MCFTKPVESITSSVRTLPLPKSQAGSRKVEDGWTPRGPGIWTDEEFSSSDEGLDATPIKPTQKKLRHLIHMERAECPLKRAERFEKTPFIVQKRRSLVYSRMALMQIRSRVSNASLKPTLPERIDMDVSRDESSTRANEQKKQPSVKKVQVNPTLIFIRAIHDIQANA